MPSDTELDAANHYLARVSSHKRMHERLAQLAMSIPTALRAAFALLRLPSLRADFDRHDYDATIFFSIYSRSAARRRRRSEVLLRVGVPQVRFASAVLRVPEGMPGYLRGRSRQAVRTNVRRARAAGLAVYDIADITEFVHSNGSWLEDGTTYVAATRQPDLRHLVVQTSDGRPLGIAHWFQYGNWARLEALRCRPEDPRSSAARYLLHTELVDRLIADRVRYLYSDSALAVPPGVRYLQLRLGYQAVNIVVRRTRSARART